VPKLYDVLTMTYHLHSLWECSFSTVAVSSGQGCAIEKSAERAIDEEDVATLRPGFKISVIAELEASEHYTQIACNMASISCFILVSETN